LPQTLCDQPDDNMSSLTSVRVLLIVFLIFIDRDAAHPFDIKVLENTMYHMANEMEAGRPITSKLSNYISKEFVSKQ